MALTSHPDLADLSKKQRLSIRRAARNGEFHLLLGAGASMDSVSKGGSPLPNSSTLASQLSHSFNVPVEEGDLLWRIYDRAVASAGEAEVYTWFQKRFWGVKHPYWMEYYARSPWATVWTLNVDDTFESAHYAVETESSRPIQVLNWDDSYFQSRDLNVVHLHGVVNTDAPRKLVFSLSEYAGSSASRASWPVNFHDSFGNSPFVILGARIRDEPDIEAVVSRKRLPNSAPSFYVARTISSALRVDLQRWGLIPVEMTAEDFVLEWGELTGLNLDSNLDAEVELGLRVGQQFIELSPNASSPSRSHDFLGGDEPAWADIQNGLAAELGWVTQAKLDLNQIGQSLNRSTIVAYTGRRLTGRSTGLFQLGKHIRDASWRTFKFRHDGRIDIDAILAYAADGKSIALLFDGAADIADDLDQLTSEARLAGANVASIVIDDSSREANLISRIKSSNFAHSRIGEINGRLSHTDAARLVDVLERVGRLGITEPMRDSARRAHFQGNNIFAAMAQLENAPGFGRRVSDVVKEVDDSVVLKAILIAAYASRVNQRLLIIDASRMLGISSNDLVGRIQNDGSLSTFLATNGTDLRARHRWLALHPVVKKLGEQTAADMVRDSIQAVSSRLSQKSLRQRNPTALLVGAFMSHRNLTEVFTDADLDSWYRSLIDIFGGWSARYWEQRAILARRSSLHNPKLLAQAESFALRATGLVADTYSFTTLGTILLEKACHVPFDVRSYYQRGWEAFEQAASLDRTGTNLVNWLAYLRYTIRVLERIAFDYSQDESDGELEEFWSSVRGDWIRTHAQVALAGATSDQVKRDLQVIRQNFESLPVPPCDSDHS